MIFLIMLKLLKLVYALAALAWVSGGVAIALHLLAEPGAAR